MARVRGTVPEGGERRVMVLDGRDVQLEGGGVQHYAPGSFYLVPPDVAEAMVAEDVAYLDGAAPTCPHCGAVNDTGLREGERFVGPRALIERHISANHADAAAPAAPPSPAEE